MKATRRIYRTNDGRLVFEGDPDAAFLAYAVGDDITPTEEPLIPGDRQAPTVKRGRRPADKSAAVVAGTEDK